MDKPCLNSNGELISLYRLEFYKKKMNWKLSQDCRQRSADTADAGTEVEEEPHPDGKKSLNTTYIVEEDLTGNGSGDFNNAFFESDLDNSESPQALNSTTLKSKSLSHKAIISTRKQPPFITQHEHNNVMSNMECNNNCGDIKYSNKQFPSGRDHKFTKDGKQRSMSTQKRSGATSSVRPQTAKELVACQQLSVASQECDQSNMTPLRKQHHSVENETSNIIHNQKLEKWSKKIYSPQRAHSSPILQNAVSQNLLEKALDIPHDMYNTPLETHHPLAKNQNFSIYEYLHDQKFVSNEQPVPPQLCSKRYTETNNCQNYYYDPKRCVKIQNYYQNSQVHFPNLTEHNQWSDPNLAGCNMVPNLVNSKQIVHFEESQLKNYCVWPSLPNEVWPQAEEAMPRPAYMPHGMELLQTPRQPTFSQYINPVPLIDSAENWLKMYKSVDMPPGFEDPALLIDSANNNWLKMYKPVDIPPGFEESSYGSEEEFMIGANLVPHSSELEINVEDAEEPLAAGRLSTAQLVAEMDRHAAALRSLLYEAARRPSPSFLSRNECASSLSLAQSAGDEESPTRDSGRFLAAEYLRCDNSASGTSDEFVAGSFKNNASRFDETPAGIGRGRGRIMNAPNKHITTSSRPF